MKFEPWATSRTLPCALVLVFGFFLSPLPTDLSDPNRFLAPRKIRTHNKCTNSLDLLEYIFETRFTQRINILRLLIWKLGKHFVILY